MKGIKFYKGRHHKDHKLCIRVLDESMGEIYEWPIFHHYFLINLFTVLNGIRKNRQYNS